MTKSLADYLTAVREAIEEPSHWSPDKFAEDREGKPCKPADAYKTCLYGALWKAHQKGENSIHGAVTLLDTIAQERGSFGFISFNAAHSHGEVMDFLEEAIRRAR